MIHDFIHILRDLRDAGVLTEAEEKLHDSFELHYMVDISPRTQYKEFLDYFNQITGKKYVGDIESLTQFKLILPKFSLPELIQCIKNAMTDPWLMDPKEFSRLTPNFILDNGKISRYYKYNGEFDKASGKSNNMDSSVKHEPETDKYKDFG